MGKLGHLVQSAFRSAGLAVSRIPPHNTLDRHLQEVFEFAGINCVLDVGAHYGEYAGLLRRLGYRGLILSFEPTPESLAIVSEKAKSDPNWRVYPWALSNVSGSRQFNVFQHSSFNSLESISEYGRDVFGLVVKEQPSVEVMRLDEVLPELTKGLTAPRVYLKIDTQGHDRLVFDGAAGVLDQIPFLQTELAVRFIYAEVGKFGDMLNYFSDRGYEPTGFFPANYERTSRVIVDLDCVMQRVGAGGSPA